MHDRLRPPRRTGGRTTMIHFEGSFHRPHRGTSDRLPASGSAPVTGKNTMEQNENNVHPSGQPFWRKGRPSLAAGPWDASGKRGIRCRFLADPGSLAANPCRRHHAEPGDRGGIHDLLLPISTARRRLPTFAVCPILQHHPFRRNRAVSSTACCSRAAGGGSRIRAGAPPGAAPSGGASISPS
jgi:hypothetical protein